MLPEESPDSASEWPECDLWIAVIERAVLDAREGRGDRAHNARTWLLASRDFLLIACYAGSENPEALRAQIRLTIDRNRQPPRAPRASRRMRVTMLTAPAGMPLWEIVEKVSRAAAYA